MTLSVVTSPVVSKLHCGSWVDASFAADSKYANTLWYTAVLPVETLIVMLVLWTSLTHSRMLLHVIARALRLAESRFAVIMSISSSDNFAKFAIASGTVRVDIGQAPQGKLLRE